MVKTFTTTGSVRLQTAPTGEVCKSYIYHNYIQNHSIVSFLSIFARNRDPEVAPTREDGEIECLCNYNHHVCEPTGVF